MLFLKGNLAVLFSLFYNQVDQYLLELNLYSISYNALATSSYESFLFNFKSEFKLKRERLLNERSLLLRAPLDTGRLYDRFDGEGLP